MPFEWICSCFQPCRECANGGKADHTLQANDEHDVDGSLYVIFSEKETFSVTSSSTAHLAAVPVPKLSPRERVPEKVIEADVVSAGTASTANVAPCKTAADMDDARDCESEASDDALVYDLEAFLSRQPVRVVGTHAPLLAEFMSTGCLMGDLAHVFSEDLDQGRRASDAACGSGVLVFDVVSNPDELLHNSTLCEPGPHVSAHGEAPKVRPAAFTLFVLALCEAPTRPDLRETRPRPSDTSSRAHASTKYIRLARGHAPRMDSPDQGRGSFEAQRSSSSPVGQWSLSEGSQESWDPPECRSCSAAWTSNLSEQVRFLQLGLALLRQRDPWLNGLFVITGEAHWPFFQGVLRQRRRDLRECLLVKQLREFLDELQDTEHVWIAPNMETLHQAAWDIREVISMGGRRRSVCSTSSRVSSRTLATWSSLASSSSRLSDPLRLMTWHGWRLGSKASQAAASP